MINGNLTAIAIEAMIKSAIKITLTKDDGDSGTE